jgi:hypothetical protein
MTRVLIAALLSSALLGGTAGAGDTKDETPALAGFTRTGEMSNCINSRQLDQVKILNKTQILFEMQNGRYYLNEPKSCPTLRKRYALKYDATIGQICSTTIVTLLDTAAGIHYQGSCGLGQFQKVEKNVAAR